MSQRVSCPHCGDEWKLHAESDRVAFNVHVAECYQEHTETTIGELEQKVEELEDRIAALEREVRGE